MARPVARVGIFFGGVLLLVVGMLTYARHNDPLDWIIFSVNQRYKNDFDIYRVQSDGSHTARFASTTDNMPSMSRPSSDSPGWLMMYDRYRGQERLRFLHLLGYQEDVLPYEGEMSSVLHYDHDQQIVYLTMTDDWFNNRTIWVWDLKTGQHTPYELPFTLSNLRMWLDDGGYIIWAGQGDRGDLYSLHFTNPLQIKQLTTHGKVLKDLVNVSARQWFYYWVDGDDPDPYNDLYRIRTDGTHEEMVAERVLNPPNAITLWGGDPDAIYYWAGANENPHLVQARPDGTQATDLPVPVIYGWVRGWSANYQWVYYSESSPDFGVPNYLTGNLRRINLQTGENSYIWETANLVQMSWSADHEWIILLTTDQQSGYSSIYRIRPDGSDETRLADNLRSLNFMPLTSRQVVFSTWGEVGKELHLLDLQTLQIYPLHDDAPPLRMRQLLAILPAPDFDWRAGWLIGIGIAAVGVGLTATRRN